VIQCLALCSPLCRRTRTRIFVAPKSGGPRISVPPMRSAVSALLRPSPAVPIEPAYAAAARGRVSGIANPTVAQRRSRPLKRNERCLHPQIASDHPATMLLTVAATPIASQVFPTED
jgi:hypothetical protein